MIKTERLILRHWDHHHQDAFAALHADPEVMADAGGPIGRDESDEKFARYVEAQIHHGISRWAVERPDGVFLGYAGVMPRLDNDHPLGAHFEVGWRLVRGVWGQGFAKESAAAALDDAQGFMGLKEIVSYTSPDNIRSQKVMGRLGLIRESALDFNVPWSGASAWVWTVPSPFAEAPSRRLKPGTGTMDEHMVRQIASSIYGGEDPRTFAQYVAASSEDQNRVHLAVDDLAREARREFEEAEENRRQSQSPGF